MTDTEKTEKVGALAEEVEGLSAELSDDELEQVAGGGSCDCAASGYGTPTGQGGICACTALGTGVTNADVGTTNPDNLRCACSGGGFGADGGGGTAGGGGNASGGKAGDGGATLSPFTPSCGVAGAALGLIDAAKGA
jgi:hypothetical protein